MKLIIKNFESLHKKQWDDKNFIEHIIERNDEYVISIWREWRRKIIQLDRIQEDKGYYQIGIFDTTTGISSVTHPYWIRLEDIQNQDIFMEKLKLLTDYWETKLI